MEIKEKLFLCDIWRIRNPKIKRYTFRQNHITGFLQRRLDYFFISNSMQNFVINTDVLASFSTDHSPIKFSFSENHEFLRGKGFWKFNSSLINNKEYIDKMRKFIFDTLNEIECKYNFDNQMKWEYLKFEIRRFTRVFSKLYAKNQRQERIKLETNLKYYESYLPNFKDHKDYISCKNKLDSIYEEKIRGIKIRSRCDWYEYGEKSSKFFLNLEKFHAVQSQVRSILIDKNEINDQNEINNHLLKFYKDLFSENIKTEPKCLEDYLNKIPIPKLSNNQKDLCEGIITEKELFAALKSMDNNKSPGNDGLTKEFYITFWSEIKKPLLASIHASFLRQELSTSQRQAIIKLTEKRDRDKRLIKNWRPISLLNTDLKLITKALASRLKKVLPFLISPNQTAYVENRFIGESGRLISDILETTTILKKEGFLVTIDIEKAFDSINHDFLLTCLKKYGFGIQFISWIKTLLTNRESCVINGGKTTKYFKLERGTRQGDPISAYLFILALEIFFIIAKNNTNINGLELFNYKFLYTAYADDTTFFVKNKKSIAEIINILNKFSCFSGLKPNKSKCEIVGIGSLNGVKVALCGMKSVNLNIETIKILGTHFSYNKELQQEKNFFTHITKIQSVLNIWRMRDLSIEGKITVFKSLAISKIIHLTLVTTTNNSIINQLEKIQKDFIWNKKSPKIRHNTLRSSYENGGLKSVDIKTKIASLQCSWIRRLYDDKFHEWKIIPSNLIQKYLGKNFKFHNSMNIKKDLVSKFPAYYQEIFNKWKLSFCFPSIVPSAILSEFLWFNSNILIDKAPAHFHKFSEKNINFVGQLFEIGKLKSWDTFRQEFNLQDSQKFAWLQIVHAIPNEWKKSISDDNGNAKHLVLYDHHITKGGLIYCLNKLSSKELYQIHINAFPNKPTAQVYFNNHFAQSNLNWKQIYLLARNTTIDTTLRVFQYKILHNILFLNKKLFTFGIVSDSKCSFCKSEDETIFHIYNDCFIIRNLWSNLKTFFSQTLNIPDLTTQSAIFGFVDYNSDDSVIINHILLIFKWFIYKARNKHQLGLNHLLDCISKIKNTEEKICENDFKKKQKFLKKWNKVLVKLK